MKLIVKELWNIVKILIYLSLFTSNKMIYILLKLISSYLFFFWLIFDCWFEFFGLTCLPLFVYMSNCFFSSVFLNVKQMSYLSCISIFYWWLDEWFSFFIQACMITYFVLSFSLCVWMCFSSCCSSGAALPMWLANAHFIYFKQSNKIHMHNYTHIPSKAV